MSLSVVVVLVLALYVLQLFLQETSRYSFDLWAIVGNRDTTPDMSIIAKRLERAKNNMQEALPLFLGIALLALIKQGDNGPAVQPAMIFLGARAAYVPAYVSGVPLLRSLIWLAGMASMAMMALPLI